MSGPRSGQPALYGNSTVKCLAQVMQKEGLTGLYRGAGVLILRGALMNSGSTLGYDGCKTLVAGSSLSDGPALHVFSSVVAAFMSCTFSAPADVVMTTYQTASQVGLKFNSLAECVKWMYREKGISVFYRGWTPLFTRVAPLYMLYLPVYEQVRNWMGIGYFS